MCAVLPFISDYCQPNVPTTLYECVRVKKSEGPSSKARQQIQFHGLFFYQTLKMQWVVVWCLLERYKKLHFDEILFVGDILATKHFLSQ